MAAGTRARLDEMDLGGAEQLGALASVAPLATAFARGCRPLALGLVEGRIGRGWLARGLRRFVESSLQRVDLFFELFDLLTEAFDVILDGWRGEFPVHLANWECP